MSTDEIRTDDYRCSACGEFSVTTTHAEQVVRACPCCGSRQLELQHDGEWIQLPVLTGA